MGSRKVSCNKEGLLFLAEASHTDTFFADNVSHRSKRNNCPCVLFCKSLFSLCL